MQISKKDGEALDQILNCAITEGRLKNPEQWHLLFYDIQTYAVKALDVDIADSKVRYYAKLLDDSGIADVDGHLQFQLNEGIVQFIESGGFSKLYDEAHYNQIQEQSDLELDRRVKNLTIRLGELELKHKKDRLLWLFVAAIISAATSALITIVLSSS